MHVLISHLPNMETSCSTISLCSSCLIVYWWSLEAALLLSHLNPLMYQETLPWYVERNHKELATYISPFLRLLIFRWLTANVLSTVVCVFYFVVDYDQEITSVLYTYFICKKIFHVFEMYHFLGLMFTPTIPQITQIMQFIQYQALQCIVRCTPAPYHTEYHHFHILNDLRNQWDLGICSMSYIF